MCVETGKTVVAAIDVLKEHGVLEKKIFLITLFTTPTGMTVLLHTQVYILVNGWYLLVCAGIRAVLNKFPGITLLTSELCSFCPTHFGNVYFGSA